jgi:Fe-S cluster assembly ATP-binding protein
MADILGVEDLYLKKGNKEIIKHFNLSVEQGSISVVLGVNGAGKSSLAYVLMGLEGYKPDGGRIFFKGIEITDKSVTERAKLGMTLAWQTPAVFEGLTVKDYIQIGMKNKSIALIKEALEKVALDPILYLNRTVDKSLSGGERKRIELAAVYAMHPDLVILDEPDSGIDILSLEKIKKLIVDFKEVDATVLLITHRDEIAEIADTAFLMCSGEIIKQGSPAEVSNFFKDECNHCDHKGIPEKVVQKSQS